MRGRTRFRGRRGRGNQFGPRTSNVAPSGLFQNEHGGELAHRRHVFSPERSPPTTRVSSNIPTVAGSSRGGGGFGGGFGGRGGFKREPGSRHPGHKYEDEAPWEMRINTDKLGASATAAAAEEDPEEERTLMAVSSQPGPKPLGITRREEKEREMIVVTTAELEARQGTTEEDSLWVSGSGSESPVEVPQDDGKVWHAAPSDMAQVKTEEGELQSVNPDVPTIDFDSHRKVPLEEAAEAKPATPKPKPKKPSDYNVDTEEQWEEESVQYILNTLASASLKETKDGDDEAPPLSEPQPFLCKFGPVMPPLRPRERPGPSVKDEPSDTPMMDQIAPVDLTADGGAGGDEDPFKHGGFVGKLVVRKSGKAELDYGGIKYTMRRGIKSSGVTSYVVLEEEDVKPGKQEQYAGRAVAMGTLMGKFNFGPVWEEQEEWVVDEEELRAPARGDEEV